MAKTCPVPFKVYKELKELKAGESMEFHIHAHGREGTVSFVGGCKTKPIQLRIEFVESSADLRGRKKSRILVRATK